MNAQTIYTDVMAAATRRQSDTEITHVFKNQNKARCEHGNITNIYYLQQRETTEQQALESLGENGTQP